MSDSDHHEGRAEGDQPEEGESTRFPRRQVALTLAGVLLALFLAMLAQTIVATALPSMVGDLGGFDRYTWVASAYVLTSAIAVPIVGRLGDIYGRKPFFILGISLFLAGSLLAGFSQSMTLLIASRTVQGIGGGAISTLGLVAVADLFPPEERGKFQGLYSVVFGVAALMGPALGGYIAESFSWRWAFFLNIPIGILALLLIAWTFPKVNQHTEDRSIDYLGMIALILAVIPALLALSWAGVEYEWVSPQIIGLLSLGTIMAVALVVIESRAKSPIMPLESYGDRVVAASLAIVFLTGAALYVSVIFVPLLFQASAEVSATASGVYLIPMVLGVVGGGVLAGRLLARPAAHYRAMGLASAGLMTAGMFLVSTIPPGASLPGSVASIVVIGLGLGGAISTVSLAVQNTVPFAMVGIATAAVNFYRLIGGMLSLAVLGAVMAGKFSRNMDEAVSNAASGALSPEQLEAIREDPTMLLAPSSALDLNSEFAAGADGLGMAEALLDSLRAALAGAVGDVLLLCAAAVSLSVIAALFLVARGQGVAPGAGDSSGVAPADAD